MIELYNFQHIRDIERDVKRPRSCSLKRQRDLNSHCVPLARKFSRSQWPLDLPRRRWAPFHPLSLCLHSLCPPPAPASFRHRFRGALIAPDFSSIGQLPNDNHTKEYCSCTRNTCVCFVYSTGVNRQCLWFPARAIPGVIQMARYGSIRNRVTAWISRDKRAEREREETVAIFMNGTLRRWNNVKMRRKRIPCNFQYRMESCSQLDKGDIFDNKARWKIELSSATRYQLFSCREQFKIIAFFPICYSDGEKWFYVEKIYQHNYLSFEWNFLQTFPALGRKKEIYNWYRWSGSGFESTVTFFSQVPKRKKKKDMGTITGRCCCHFRAKRFFIDTNVYTTTNLKSLEESTMCHDLYFPVGSHDLHRQWIHIQSIELDRM